MPSLDASRRLKAIYARHHQIQQHHMWTKLIR
jgi:hypothetical protein